MNAAVIGLGVGEQHAHAYRRDTRAVLAAVVDHDAVKTGQFLEKCGDDRPSVRSFEDVVCSKDMDIISIASFDDDHYAQVMAALENGKHVFVEKPLCQTERELKKIHALWKKKKTALRSNLVLRAADLYVWLRDYIRQGNLGEIYAFDGDYLYGRIHKITSGWRADSAYYSVMEGGGIHIIDLMMYLTDQKPRAVSAVANKIATRDTAFRFPDFQAATFTFEKGMIGRISANFGCVHRHHHVIRVFGTKGTFLYDDAGPRICLSRAENEVAQPVSLNPLPDNKGIIIPGFIDSIASGDVEAAAQREFDLMAAVLAADKSLKTHKTQTIGYMSC